MPHAIPVSAASTNPALWPIDNLIADISWVTPGGQLAQELASVPVQDGIALYDGPPLQPGLYWAIRIRREGGPGALYRSGPLQHLPGPPSPPPSGQVSFLLGAGNYTVTEPASEGQPHIVARELQDLPAPFEFAGVELGIDPASNYMVTLYMRVRLLGPFRPPFVYRRAFRLMGSEDPGWPTPPVLARPVPAPLPPNPAAWPYVPVLTRLMKAAVERQFEASVVFLAWATLEIAGAGFVPQTTSVSGLRLFIPGAGPIVYASVRVAGGAITPAPAPP